MSFGVYNEPGREIPISHDVDVLVTGAGPAGVAAAVAAARMGVRTLLAEQLGTVGGMSASGMMSHWAGSSGSPMYAEILREGARRRDGNGQSSEVNIDPEKIKAQYFDMLNAAGAEVLLYTLVCGAITESGRLAGVITESKSGRRAIRAKVTIDASGDGDVAALAGASFTKGREDDGLMQPATLMFKVGGVDTDRAAFLSSFEDTYQTPQGELQALAREHLPHPAGHVLLYRTTLPGIVTCNMTNCTGVDGATAEGLTKAEQVCRSQMDAIEKFLRRFVPGYENCFIISSASLVGIRETRHFKGLYTLTEQDILEARQFPDWITRKARFNFDVHNITGAGLDKTGVQARFSQQNGYDIPYGCLVPESVDGLLLSGRNISGTHMAHSNYRVMPICVGIGEGAGIAAALCARKGIQPRQLDPAEIQAVIERNEQAK